jgi:hypothetical protein
MLFTAFICERRSQICVDGSLPQADHEIGEDIFGANTYVCDDGSKPITETTLAVDDRVLCEDSDHQTLQNLSLFLIVTIAVGVPVTFFGLLLSKSWQAADVTDNQKQYVANEMGCDRAMVSSFVRDVQVGNSYGFLVDSFKSSYLFWEPIDML